MTREEFIKQRCEIDKITEEEFEEITDYYCKASNIKWERAKRIIELKNQQKKFIKYLEDEIERKRLNATCTTEYNDYVVPLKHVLQKFKEITGVSDENN